MPATARRRSAVPASYASASSRNVGTAALLNGEDEERHRGSDGRSNRVSGKMSAGLRPAEELAPQGGELLNPLGFRGVRVERQVGAGDVLEDHERPAAEFDVPSFQGVEQVGHDGPPAADQLG